MFEHHEQEQQLRTSRKKLKLIQNGNSKQTYMIESKKNITRLEIMKLVERKWGSGRYRNLRIFDGRGFEYFDEDLQFVKDRQELWVSKGEDFDESSHLGEYEMVRELGRGGFGHVSLVRNTITNAHAAIKVLKNDRIKSSSDIDMIFRQAEYLQTLNHPHIVRILNCYTVQHMKVVLVMEYMEGGELKEYLRKKGKLTESEAKNFFKQIINAVRYCHQKGLVHRDLKLENILMKDESVVKVSDFGISGVVNRFNAEVDWGTLRYMSPEVLSKRQKINTTAVDIWAMGVILYYMVCGEPPFCGHSSSKIKQKIIYESPHFPSYLSSRCISLLKELLCKDPESRITLSQLQQHCWLTQQAQPEIPIRQEAKTLSPSIKNIKKRKYDKVRTFKNITIPKRLQKEKNQLAEELQICRLSRKFFQSENKKTSGRLPTKYYPQFFHTINNTPSQKMVTVGNYLQKKKKFISTCK